MHPCIQHAYPSSWSWNPPHPNQKIMSNNNIQITSPSFPVWRLHNLPPWGLQKTKYQENLQVLGSEKAWIKKNAEQPSGGKGYHMFIHPWHQTNNYRTICWAPQCHNQMNILVANTINLCKTTSQTDHHCLHLRWKANPYMSISLKVVSKANVFWESFNRVATRFRNRVIGI